MPFEPSDFEELIRFLDAHPDMRDQLRRRILSDDFLHLPIDVQELREGLAEGFAELRDGLAELRQTVITLAESVQTVVRVIDGLIRSVESLAVTVARLLEVVEPMAERQERMELAITRLTERVDRFIDGPPDSANN